MAQTTTPTNPQEIINQVSQLTPVQAGAAFAATLLGEQLPPELQLELVKFLRDNLQSPTVPGDPEQTKAFVDALVQGTLNTALNGVTLPNLQGLGINLPIAPGEVPSIQQVWDTYGLAKTTAFLVAALVVPDAAPILLPGNIRVPATYTRTQTLNATTGQPFVPAITTGVTVGRSFTNTTTINADILLSTALDNPTVTDLITIHAPTTVALAITVRCTRVTLGRCTQISTTSATTTPSTVFATNPTYTFAYPLNAGQFPTRLTAQDLFQTAYDALGTVYKQKARDPLFVSPFASLPGFQPLVPGTGLADLATQAPPVNYFGLSTREGAVVSQVTQGVVDPVLDALKLGKIRTREREALPYTIDLDGGEVLPGITIPDYALGMTAAYRADEIRSGQTNIMVVRWHNIGALTVGETLDNASGELGFPNTDYAGALPSAPASIFYDVPAGQYIFGETRADTRGAVYKTDWRVAAPGLDIPIPPTLPEPGLLQNLLGGDLLGGLLGGGEGGLFDDLLGGVPTTP